MGELAIRSESMPAKRESNPALVYLAGLQPTGRRSMQGALGKVATMMGHSLQSMPWDQLRYDYLVGIRAKLSETLAPATVNRYLSAIRGTLKAAWRMGLIDSEVFHRTVDVAGVKNETLPAGRALSIGEISALVRACQSDDTDAGARDTAIVAVLYAAGLRRAEIVALDLADLQDGDELMTLTVRGKGNKSRLSYLNDGARFAMLAWLAVRGDAPGAVFWAGRRGGHLIRGQGMSAQAVRDLIHRRADQAGIGVTSPHDMRRTFITHLLDANVDIATVAALAGHKSVDTTRKYDRRPETAKQKAVSMLHVPYRRR